jgi:hypothetical protein
MSLSNKQPKSEIMSHFDLGCVCVLSVAALMLFSRSEWW